MTGYGSFLYLVPEFDLGVYLAYNQESGALINAVLSQLMSAVFPHRSNGPELRPRRTDLSDASRFAGTYADNTYHHTDPTTGWRRRPFEIELNDNALMFQSAPAYRVGRLDFQRDDGVLLSFREGENGRITHLIVNQSVYERLGSP